MPTNGMTIDSLNTVSSLTAQDEVPVWDKEASGEPTRKITAQNLTNSVKTLGSLVNTKEMNTAIAQSTASDLKSLASYLSSLESDANAVMSYAGKMRTISFQGVIRAHAEDDILMTLPQEHRPIVQSNSYFSGTIGGTSAVIAINGLTGNVSIYLLNGATSTTRLYFSATYMVK